ncbi:MAG: PIN domain-containing protein [Firmicutes bacterium]|nr:PIN domain-containing protein [Bacillota bacterium]
MVILDTNTILRYLLQDNSEMADIVEKTLDERPCLITVEIVAELVYVLTKVYKIDRKSVANMLRNFFTLNNISIIKKEIVSFALTLFIETNLSFVDSLLVSYSSIENYEVLTFDKELKRYLGK